MRAVALLILFVAAACSRTELVRPDTGADLDASIAMDPSNLGTEFYAVSTSNSFIDARNIFHYAVAFGNSGATPAHVTIEGASLREPIRVDVPPHGAVTQVLPWVRELSQHSYRPERDSFCFGVGDLTYDFMSSSTIPNSALVRHGAYHIRSDAPISAYQFDPLEYSAMGPDCLRGTYTNDASLLLPVHTLGERYLTLSHRGVIRSAPSFFVVVGTASRTRVTITPSADVKAGQGVRASAAGVPIEVVLDEGDAIELMARTDGMTFGGDDLSGSEIVSDHPVAVFAGVDCTRVGGENDETPACDHLEQQMTPVTAWGREFVAMRFRDREMLGNPAPHYRLRIMARDDGTTIHFEPSSLHMDVTLAAREIFTLDGIADLHIQASAPVLAAEYMFGGNESPNPEVGDPSMALLVPTSQYRNDYAFVTPATYTHSFVSISGPIDANIEIDGQRIATSPSQIRGTNWATWTQELTPGSHVVRSDVPGGVGTLVYGVAPYTSYAYPGGMNLEVQE